MTSVRRRATARLTAGLLSAGLLVAVTGAEARAQQGASPDLEGATATLQGLKLYDQAVIKTRDGSQKTGAGLFEMAVEGGGTLQTYGVDPLNSSQEQARYQESAWKESTLHNNRNSGRIRWVLQHSYPHVNDLTKLARKAGARQLTKRTAAAGTQVAIWRLADRTSVRAVNPSAQKLADHLVRTAKRLPEPRASLSVSSTEVAGRSGDRVGPITVRTSASRVTVSPAVDAASLGVKLVDREGEEVTSARDGSRLYFQLPKDAEPGASSLTVEASTKVPVGRVLTGLGENAKTQPQVLAGSSQSTVAATSTVNWAEGGAIPAVTARKNCSKRGVDVHVDNRGDRPFVFELDQGQHRVDASKTETVTVPVREDQAYRIAIATPSGGKRVFSGVLDCENVGAPVEQAAGLTTQTGPATVGGGQEPGTTDLAETGANNNTMLIAGVAVAFIVVGGLAVLMVRVRKPEESEEEAGQAVAPEADADGSTEGTGPEVGRDVTAAGEKVGSRATGAEGATESGEAPRSAAARPGTEGDEDGTGTTGAGEGREAPGDEK
ncbi:thioester domain-containing protein [Streptomyces sp. NPDC005438]|uniref:thioester domain-containing protein n=1 Tax=Streptomyces sp. NPDC005438 TaxID=3156880 RepID=UPI0033A4D84C